ncbi:hypothetical protein [Dyella japonica]|uniref:Uncharacterized protein n=1 Tax=Dyella japonica A8 TaxID=1217721 RepID=A0A075JVJ9_9GAMM|nr:hypothetical protein [Dyella japonica]AIF46116.1 hypothetical protein HY57_02025 [Dyella japonica A8]
MTGYEVKRDSDAKAKDQEAKVQSPARAGQPQPSYYVAGQGAPGGTCDDDGTSENQQGDSGRGAAKPNT